MRLSRGYLFSVAVGLMLLASACNGQLIYERVVTVTPDPNQVIVTITPTPASSSVATEQLVTAPATIAAMVTPAATIVTTANGTENATQEIAPTLSAFPTETRAEIYIAQQDFEHGYMFWISTQNIMWVLVQDEGNPNTGVWYAYRDTYKEGESEGDALTPPEAKYVPRRGFGKLWRETEGLRDRLGWGLTPEFGLNTPYVYQPGGFIDASGKYIPGPGKHFLTTLSHQVFAMSEPDDKGIARWQRVS